MPQTRISEIIHGRRRITADTAIRLSRYFGTSAEFWIGLQTDFDLEESRREIESDIDLIPTFQASWFSRFPFAFSGTLPIVGTCCEKQQTRPPFSMSWYLEVTVRGTVPFDFISLILLYRGEGWRIAACQSLSSAPAASARGWISVHNHHTPETTSEACFCTDSFPIACPVVFYTES